MRLPTSLRIFVALVAFATLTIRVSAKNFDLTVYAAASLSDALKELGHRFETQHGVHVQFNLAGSNQLARQIKEGAPADVFFSADELKMDDLAKSELIENDTRRSLLSNTLVLIVNAKNPALLNQINDLGGNAIKKIALAQTDTVPAGVYSKKYLVSIGLWPAVQPKVIETENVRAALAAVATDNVDAGIVYKTDALISKDVRVAVEVSAQDGPKISYPVAVVKQAAHEAVAREFVKYLTSSDALSVFRRFGFTTESQPNP
jgi:molybdate transport system substrate-binding protein